MKNSTAGFFLVLVLGLVIGAAGVRWYEGYAAAPSPAANTPAAAPAEANKAIAVEVATVKQISLARGVSAVGTLRSENSVMLRPAITGRIVQFNFKEGGKVNKGQRSEESREG